MTRRQPGRGACVVLAAIAIATAVSACGRTAKRDPDRDRYACDAGLSFHADIGKGREAVWVRLPTHAFRMDRVETDVGDMYVRGRNTLSVEEEVATLVTGDGTRYTNCRRPGTG